MRDIFSELFKPEPADPTEAARRAMRPTRRARFYKEATVGEGSDGLRIELDGRPVRTPAGRTLMAPARELAHAIAAEWQAQGEFIDPASMPLTRLGNAIIDGVADAPEPVAAEIEKYLGSDLLFYRAEGPEGLVALQAQRWDPVLEWAREALGARFVLGQGVIHVEQPAAAIAAAAKAIPRDDAWRLGALCSITTLTGSALLALALAQGQLTMEAAWDAAHVDDDWNVEKWGRDEIALARRAARRTEMQAAAMVLSALR